MIKLFRQLHEYMNQPATTTDVIAAPLVTFAIVSWIIVLYFMIT